MAVWDELLYEDDKKLLAELGMRNPRVKRGFGDRPALLIIDMGNGAVGEDRPIWEQVDQAPYTSGPYAWAAIPHIQKLKVAARAAGIPVICFQGIWKLQHDLPGANDPNFHLSELNPLSKLHPSTAPEEGDLLIQKHHASGFFQTPLLAILLHKNIDTLILTGNATSGCVRATAVDASYYPNFQISVVEEAVFDRFLLSHKAALFDMAFKYCNVVKADETLEYFDKIGAVAAEQEK